MPPAEFSLGTEGAGAYFAGQHQFYSTVSSSPTSFSFGQLGFPSSFNPQPSPPTSQTHAHVPRPPNAFMLYRSNFLRSRLVPPNVECRQQNLSRVAGQCWNLLPPKEKGQWQEEAAKALVEHQRRYPNYKFTPAPRGTRRAKDKGRANSNADVDDSEDRIRQIRERYTELAGPSAAPSRRRRPRTENHLDNAVKHEDSISRGVAAIALSPSVSPSPSLSSESDSALSLSFESPPSSFDHAAPPRRPSTSLGFSTSLFVHNDDTSSPSGGSLTRPVSAGFSATDLCDPLRDFDIVCSICQLVFILL
jgi:HMG (high mobility group) box